MELQLWDVGTGATAPPSLKVVGKYGMGNAKCDKSHNDYKFKLLVKREMNHNVWHKLREL